MTAERETIAAPTDPQVTSSEADGHPSSNVSQPSDAHSTANQTVRALHDDWGMARGDDGKLYCRHCIDRITNAKACATEGHPGWTDWWGYRGFEYRECQRCDKHEKRPAP